MLTAVEILIAQSLVYMNRNERFVIERIRVADIKKKLPGISARLFFQQL